MLITKLFFELGLFLLGCFFYDNSTSPNNTIIVTDLKKDKVVMPKSQTPGKEIYTDFCIQCHGADGKGDSKKFPPLAGSDWLLKKRAQSIRAVKFGQSGQIVVNKMKFNNIMPPMGLSNQEVADVMNYIMNSWGNRQRKMVTEKEVERIRK